MNKLKTLLIVTLAIGLVTVFAGSALGAATLYVDNNGSDTDPGGTEGDPYATITHALSKATAGDTIMVDNGSYTTPDTTAIDDGSLVVNQEIQIVASNWYTSTDGDAGSGATDNVALSGHSDVGGAYNGDSLIQVTADKVEMYGTDTDNDGTVDIKFSLTTADIDYVADVSTSDTDAISELVLQDFVATGGSFTDGINIVAATDVEVDGVEVKDSTIEDVDTAIKLDNSSSSSNFAATVSGNDVGADSSAITNGIVLNTGNSGTFNNTSVTDNTVNVNSGGSEVAIDLTAIGATVSQNKLTANSIQNTTVGIAISASSNTLKRNEVRKFVTGISLTTNGPSNNTFQGNYVTNNTTGVLINDAGASGNSFTWNYIAGNGTTDVDASDNKGANNVLNDNTFSSSATAVDLSSSSGEVNVDDNWWGTNTKADMSSYLDGAANTDYNGDFTIKTATDSDIDEVVVNVALTDDTGLDGQAAFSTPSNQLFGYDRFAAIGGGATGTAPYDAMAIVPAGSSSGVNTVTVKKGTTYSNDVTIGVDYLTLISNSSTVSDVSTGGLVTVSADVTGFTIEGITFDATDAGISVTAPSSNNITGTIDNNVFKSRTSTAAINIGGSSSYDENVTVTNNEIKSSVNAKGVNLQSDASGVTIGSSDNGNTIDGTTSGIVIASPTASPNGEDISITIDSNVIRSSTATSDGKAGIVISGSSDYTESVTVKNNVIYKNDDAGIELQSNVDGVSIGTNDETGNTIKNNTAEGIDTDSGGNTLRANTIKGNDSDDGGDYSVRNTDTSTNLDAKYNYWGYASGPFHPTKNVDGEGTEVSDYVDFEPYWTKVSGFETIRGLKPPSIRPDEPGSLSSISAVGLDVYIYTLHLGWEMV